MDVLRHCCSSLHARRILCNQGTSLNSLLDSNCVIDFRSGTIERLADVINRSHSTDMACCIAATRALVHLADKSSIGIREVYLSSGCLPLLLQVTCELRCDTQPVTLDV